MTSRTPQVNKLRARRDHARMGCEDIFALAERLETCLSIVEEELKDIKKLLESVDYLKPMR